MPRPPRDTTTDIKARSMAAAGRGGLAGRLRGDRRLSAENRGPTNHIAILARALGIPAIVSSLGALVVTDGTLVLFDGSTGILELGIPERQWLRRSNGRPPAAGGSSPSPAAPAAPATVIR